MKIDLLQVAIFIIVLMIISFVALLILNEYSPFKLCEDKPDNYTVSFDENSYITCGELKAVNTSLSNMEILKWLKNFK